jgi:uncharacterized membrane protein
MADTPDPLDGVVAGAPRRRWLTITLFVSLAMNLFLVGGLVGAVVTGMRFRPAFQPPGPPRGPVMQAIHALPPERQAAWRAANPDYVRSFGPRVFEARRMSREAFLRFGEEPFPHDAILAQLKQARALEVDGRTAMDQRLVDFAATLPQAERAAFGQALARPPIRGLGRRGPRGPGPDGRGEGLPDRQ